MTTPSPCDLLVLDYACRYVGVSPSTLRKWEAADKLPAYGFPGNQRRFYSRDDLDKINASREAVWVCGGIVFDMEAVMIAEKTGAVPRKLPKPTKRRKSSG